jgi:hypothetical protein
MDKIVDKTTKVANIVVFVAEFAHFPPKWRAGSSRAAAELTFCVGEKLPQERRNGTNAAKCSRVTAAVQFMSAAAVVAAKVASLKWQDTSRCKLSVSSTQSSVLSSDLL